MMQGDPTVRPSGGFDRAHMRALIAIVIVNFVSLAGFGLMFPVFAVHGHNIGATSWQIASAAAVFSFGQFLSSPVWGKLSDRYGRRRTIIASLSAGALAYILHIYAVTPATLLFARFLSGLATGGMSVAFAVASDISTPQTRTRIMGIVGAGFSLGFIFGPAIGGIAASLATGSDGFTVVCIAGAGLTLVAVAICWWALPETRAMHPEQEDGAPKAKIALRDLPGLRMPILIGFLTAAAFAQLEATLTLFADDVLRLKPFGIGLLFGGMGIVSTVTQLTVTARIGRKLGEAATLCVAIAIMSAGFLFLGLARELTFALLGLFCTSTAFALINPTLATLTSLAAPRDAQGAAQGAQQSTSALGRVFGPAFAGLLYSGYGASLPFYAGAGMLAVTFFVALLGPLPGRKPSPA
jgi:MFS family permease